MKTKSLWVSVFTFAWMLCAGLSAFADETTIKLQGDTPSLWSWYQRQGDEYKTTHPWLHFLRDTCAASAIEECTDKTFRKLPVGTILTVAAPVDDNDKMFYEKIHRKVSAANPVMAAPEISTSEASALQPKGAPALPSVKASDGKQSSEDFERAAAINGLGFLISSLLAIALFIRNQKLRCTLADQQRKYARVNYSQHYSLSLDAEDHSNDTTVFDVETLKQRIEEVKESFEKHPTTQNATVRAKAIAPEESEQNIALFRSLEQISAQTDGNNNERHKTLSIMLGSGPLSSKTVASNFATLRSMDCLPTPAEWRAM